MRRSLGRLLPAALGAAAISAAGCGGSSGTSTSGTSSVPSSVVRQGNAPVVVRFGEPAYLAACEKSMETPNSQGAALSAAQAKAFCGCVQQQAASRGLASESEKSITLAQFRSLFSTCLAPLRQSGSAATS